MNLKPYTFYLFIILIASCSMKKIQVEKQENKLINTEKNNCEKTAEILDEVYKLDQNMRLNGKYNPQTDLDNLSKIIKIIKECGMPTTKEVTKKQIFTIWLVFQHADNESRKEYFPLLKEAEKNGDLKKKHIAIMQDRILMNEGKPQIYGSQIIENRETKKWEIYNLEKPEFVDKRRKKVGLGSLKEYVKEWNIEFKIKQSE